MASFTKSAFVILLLNSLVACSTGGTASDSVVPIENPFGDYAYAPRGKEQQNITLRTKRGDQSVEVELPHDSSEDLVVPMNPKFTARNSDGAEEVAGVDYRFKDQKATTADREIASTFTGRESPEEVLKKREIEQTLGLQTSDETPAMDESYLAKMDVVKQLFKQGRYEASMIEIDRLVKVYPTNERLYEMRGTVLDRLGYPDLALRSWKQALELAPTRVVLKKLIEKREAQKTLTRGVASEKEGKY